MSGTDVSVIIGSQMAANWTDYVVTLDMLEPADTFALTFGPVRRDLWDLVKTDTPVEIRIGDITVLTGFIDERICNGSANTIEITGRCKAGRLVDESMDLISFEQTTVVDAIERIVEPWFDTVTVSNARNRAIVLGRKAAKSKVIVEPVTLSLAGLSFAATVFPGVKTYTPGSRGRRIGPKKVEPGEKRWETMEHFLELDRLLAWSSADGRELIIGQANYNQDSQFSFLAVEHGSNRSELANVEDWIYGENIAERFSQVTVVGASRGNSKNYSSRITKNWGAVIDGEGTGGIGRDFQQRKILIVAHDGLKDREEATALAQREMAKRDASGTELTLTVRGHHQALTPNAEPALYTFDTMANFEDETIGVKGRYLITAVTYSGSRDSHISELRLVPEGTELTT
jgi:prophage tail gpP-like protein